MLPAARTGTPRGSNRQQGARRGASKGGLERRTRKKGGPAGVRSTSGPGRQRLGHAVAGWIIAASPVAANIGPTTRGRSIHVSCATILHRERDFEERPSGD